MAPLALRQQHHERTKKNEDEGGGTDLQLEAQERHHPARDRGPEVGAEDDAQDGYDQAAPLEVVLAEATARRVATYTHGWFLRLPFFKLSARAQTDLRLTLT